MDITLLRAFLEVADAGAFSRAARRIGIAQPSLSLQIQRLEQQLGTTLFERHGRGVALTDVGKGLYPRARRIVDDVRAAEEAVRREVAEGFGSITVGAIPTIAPYVLPAALERLQHRHPGARVVLREDYSAVLVDLLREGAIDVAIAALPYDFGTLPQDVLGSEMLLVAVPALHPAARAGKITVAQLQDAPTVTLDPVHCLGEQVAGFCDARQVNPSVVCRSAQLTTVFEMVGAGMGLSIVPQMAAAKHNTSRCAVVPLADMALERDIIALWPRDRAPSKVAMTFVDCVRQVVNGAS
ncbi:MAG TPA: LysR family transcriptional regulator [Gemmatimonas aurantiaca]|uniref:LysR family transcriptional regulator n=2 Tax=Gemmatimonas aurantiaca TaxID=173480 RepID=C1A9Z7_GEMAT|nr:LysR family transcriptional regulator [Gemmatimonas aurantiaca]BAH39595.1 LysR family transcriptional regulator [Gemmatimonas aurantiaca T-27]HCT58395.1 LysR family transcriptional regulator [Gemmatimonas aurantiaca]